jgi:hypothetical protein
MTDGECRAHRNSDSSPPKVSPESLPLATRSSTVAYTYIRPSSCRIFLELEK